MQINESKNKDIVILELLGKLDATNALQLQEKMRSNINEGEVKFLIDCRGLEYMSSAGLRVFYWASNQLQSSKGRIAFCSLNEHIKNVFEVVNMEADFQTFGTRNEAQESLSKPLQQSSEGV